MKRKLIYILLPLTLLFACLGFVACNDKLPERLSTPENVRAEGKLLVWDSVKNADGYSLLIEQQEYETAENYFDMSMFDETGIYNVELMAYSNRAIGNSEVVAFEFAGRFSRPTKGLQYELLSNGTVRVSRMAVDENGVCVIPATYSGYKVTDFITASSGNSMTPWDDAVTPHAACPNIKTLYVPYTIGANVSAGKYYLLENLEEIVIGKDLENGETRFVSEGNCIIDKQENSVVLGTLKSVIPDYVTKIGNSAFAGRNITSFTVPDQITQIGLGAFSGCTALTEFHLPKNFTQEEILFLNGCSALTEFTIPEGVVNLDEAFSGCSSLKEVQIPESVQSMWGTFMNCTSLERCVIPKNVKSLEGTFYRCTSLKEVVLPEGLEEIEYANGGLSNYPAFYKCETLTSIELPSTLKTIGRDSFYGCKSLKSIHIPDSVTSIGDGTDAYGLDMGVFGSCTSLTEVTLPASLTAIAAKMFRGCSSLTSIQIPDGVTRISSYAFRDCTALTHVSLPASLTDLRLDAFKGCTSLEFIDIPENAGSYSVSRPCYAFADCTSLKAVVLQRDPQMLNNMFKTCPLEEVYFRETKEEWESSGKEVPETNEALLAAEWYFYSETQPEEEGNYWHYVNGVLIKW